MKSLLLILFSGLVTLLSTAPLAAQDINNSPEVLMAKGNALLNAYRYDEAVRTFNRIIGMDESYHPAYAARAEAKFKLAAYKGTKMDLVKHMELAGLGEPQIILLAETESKLNNYTAAANYVGMALKMQPYNPDLLYLAGDIYDNSSKPEEACVYYERASALGHNKARDRWKQYCGGVHHMDNQGEKERIEVETPTQVPEDKDIILNEEEEIFDDGEPSLEDIISDDDNEDNKTNNSTTNEINDPNAVNEIFIDEKLTLRFSDGIGGRKINSKPNIFILSSEDGLVVLDVCIDQAGNVSTANYNKELSSITRTSLISLAIRKAQQFTFYPTSQGESCGLLTFNIKA